VPINGREIGLGQRSRADPNSVTSWVTVKRRFLVIRSELSVTNHMELAALTTKRSAYE
jgi:hypothetical protein